MFACKIAIEASTSSSVIGLWVWVSVSVFSWLVWADIFGWKMANRERGNGSSLDAEREFTELADEEDDLDLWVVEGWVLEVASLVSFMNSFISIACKDDSVRLTKLNAFLVWIKYFISPRAESSCLSVIGWFSVRWMHFTDSVTFSFVRSSFASLACLWRRWVWELTLFGVLLFFFIWEFESACWGPWSCFE